MTCDKAFAYHGSNTSLIYHLQRAHPINVVFIICPIAIAYSIGQIIKSVCVCQTVRLWALSRSHFLIDFHQTWHRRKKPQ